MSQKSDPTTFSFRPSAHLAVLAALGLLLAGSSAGTLAVVLHADEEPFAEAPAKAAPKVEAKKGAEVVESDPAVLAVRDSKPATPEQLTWAIRVMLDLGRPDEAKRYLARLAGTKPDDATWVAIHARFGVEFFRRLKQERELQPEGTTLADAALNAVRKQSLDQARLTTLVGKLSDASAANRREAEVGLRDAGTAAIEPLVKALADEALMDEHFAIQRMLVSLGSQAVEPLLGVLENPAPALATRLYPVLGALESRRAIPYLLRPALDERPEAVHQRNAAAEALRHLVGEEPTYVEATQFLYKRALAHLKGDPPVRLDADNRGVLWHWDATARTARPRQYLAPDLAVAEATRLARELHALAPDHEEFLLLHVLTDLEDDKLLGGVDQPLSREPNRALQRARQRPVEVLENVLAFALKHQRYVAAAAVIEVLGESGDLELLSATDGTPRRLAAALTHSDRRVRFAAVSAIMRLDPRGQYPGASYFADSLGFLVSTVGSRRALVVHPRTTEAQSWVGKLAELGFDADAAHHGRTAFILAQRHADYEFLLISDAVQSPPVSELVQALRQEGRTARLPIGVIAHGESLDRASRVADLEPLVQAYPRPVDTDSMGVLVRRLQDGIGRSAVTRDERLIHAAAALEWLTQLTSSDTTYSFYQLPRLQPSVESALQTPELATRAAAVLGHFGSARCQSALIDLASSNRPATERRAAASAFRDAVRRRGLLLTREEILRQYERYNQSASADRETQEILGLLLDAIERRDGVSEWALSYVREFFAVLPEADGEQHTQVASPETAPQEGRP